MPNRRHKSNQHIKMANIMSRLPLQRQLSLSQAMLVKLSPSWLNWKNKNFKTNIADSLTLTNYENNTLTIHCDNAISASQLKHQQPTLLTYFQSQGFVELEQIIVRITHPTQSSYSSNSPEPMNSPERNNSLEPMNSPEPIMNSDNTPSKEALESIIACEKITKSDHLANSKNR